MKLLQLLVFMFSVCLASSERTAVFFGKQAVCKEYNKEYFHNITCGMKLVNRTTQTYSLFVSTKSGTIDNLRLRLTTYYKFRTVYRASGLVVNEDACYYLKFLNKTMATSFENFKDISFPNVKCPLKGPMILNLKDLILTPQRLPPFVPIGDWIFETITYTIVDGKEVQLTKIKNYFVTSYKYT